MHGRCPNSDMLTRGLPAILFGTLYVPERKAAASHSSHIPRDAQGCRPLLLFIGPAKAHKLNCQLVTPFEPHNFFSAFTSYLTLNPDAPHPSPFYFW